jgi:hypothetical protein
MTVRTYYSTDTSAPVLSGTAGAAVGVLSACLVDGYGSRTAAGWSKTTGTNKAAYRGPVPPGSPPEGTRFYVRVDDAGTTTANARGYESMSDVDTGLEPYPTVAQAASGVTIRKSSTADATARPWGVIASEQFFIFIAQTNSAVAGERNTADCSFLFGDYRTYKTGDASYSHIVGSSTSGTSSDSFLDVSPNTSFTAAAGHYLSRAYTGASGAVGFRFTSKRAATLRSGAGFLSDTDRLSGTITLDQAYLVESTGSTSRIAVRGFVPGIWVMQNANGNNSANSLGLSTFDTIAVADGQLSGKTLMFVRTSVDGFFVEISDTW